MKFILTGVFAALLASTVESQRIGNLRLLQDANCASYDANGACSQCIPRTVLIEGKCTAVSDLCKAWDLSNGECTQCYGGYELSQGKCAVPSSAPVINDDDANDNEEEEQIEEQVPTQTYDACSKFDQSGACVECSFRSILKDGKCLAVSNQCKDWNKQTGDCTECYGGFTLTEGACVL